jgi:integrase
MVQVHVPATVWGFESLLRHQELKKTRYLSGFFNRAEGFLAVFLALFTNIRGFPQFRVLTRGEKALAARTVNLYKYVHTADGWRYFKAAFHSNNRIKPHTVLTPDGEKTVKDGKYYLYHNRRWEAVGDDPNEAQRALLRKRGEVLTIANGGQIAQTEATTKVSGTLRGTLDEWLQDIEDGDWHQDTYDAKRLVADEFCLSCKGVKLLSAVTRKHCQNYINAWLKKRGSADRTRFNKFLHLRQFLHRNGLTEHLTTKDAPEFSVKDPLAFEDEELSLFWQVCPPHKQLRYELLVSCGLRKQEIETLRWVDILWNEGVIRIQPRMEWGFSPKKEHCRDINIPEPLLEKLRIKKLTSKSELLFATKSGKPKLELWDDVQALCKKLDKLHPDAVPKEKWHPHIFRATYCSTLIRQGVPIPDVMRLMGHKDVASTMRYMAVLQKSKLRERIASVRFPVPS